MARQVSAYIRLSSPPTSISGYMRLESSSEWSRSSLLCAAVETVTLPTRVRGVHGRQGSLAEFENVLNKTGSQTIFDLKANVAAIDGSDKHPSAKMPLLNKSQVSHPPDLLKRTLDLDYSPRGGQTTLGRTAHLFGQVEIRRCGTQKPIVPGGSDDQDAIIEWYAPWNQRYLSLPTCLK